MSEFRDVLTNVLTDRQPWTGDQITNLRTGKTFVAEIEEVTDIELATELGRDPRESVILHVLDRTAVEEQLLNDQVQCAIGGSLVTFVLIRRTANPISLQTDFGCMKKVSGKDS